MQVMTLAAPLLWLLWPSRLSCPVVEADPLPGCWIWKIISLAPAQLNDCDKYSWPGCGWCGSSRFPELLFLLLGKAVIRARPRYVGSPTLVSCVQMMLPERSPPLPHAMLRACFTEKQLRWCCSLPPRTGYAERNLPACAASGEPSCHLRTASPLSSLLLTPTRSTALLTTNNNLQISRAHFVVPPASS